MLYITTNPDDSRGSTYGWHVGEVNPLKRVWGDLYRSIAASKEIIVQADGVELLHIIDEFQGIPKTNTLVQSWYGDDAKFIAVNL